MNYQHYDLPNADITSYYDVDLGHSADALFDILMSHIDWQQRSITMYGVERLQPRLVAWYSDYSYSYSGLKWDPKPLTPILAGLCDTMSRLTGTPFNGVLLNLYHDGQSSIGMHSDDEPEFGLNPTIASLSLGSSRRFDFQRKDKSPPVVNIPLNHGDVLVMAGETQTYWKHGIAKTKKPVGPRINLTFRYVVN